MSRMIKFLSIAVILFSAARIGHRIAANYRATFEYAPALVDVVAGRCREAESGARNVEQILARTLLPELSARLLERMAAAKPVAGVHVGVDDAGEFSYRFD